MRSDLDTVDRLWPGLGREMGLMMKLLEEYWKAAWGRDGVDVLTVEDLGLKVGGNGGDLVSTEDAFGRYHLLSHSSLRCRQNVGATKGRDSTLR